MRTFLACAMLVYAALAAWSHLDRPEGSPPSGWMIWALVLLLPASLIWAVTEAVNFMRPRRLLDPRVRAPLRRTIAGLVAGALGAVLVTLGLVFLEGSMPDWLIIGAGSTLGALAVVVPMRRLRPGRCVHCGYDVSAATVRGGGLCAECGASAFA